MNKLLLKSNGRLVTIFGIWFCIIQVNASVYNRKSRKVPKSNLTKKISVEVDDLWNDVIKLYRISLLGQICTSHRGIK